MNEQIQVTDAAAKKVHQLISEEGNEQLKLRVYIVGGGCSGFQYGFAFDEKQNDDDLLVQKIIIGHDKISVGIIIDAMSMLYLTGAEVDYVESLQGSHFVVNNPNAQTTCGCGASFSI